MQEFLWYQDVKEAIACYITIMEEKARPRCIVLSDQDRPDWISDGSTLRQYPYFLEVSTAEKLRKNGIKVLKRKDIHIKDGKEIDGGFKEYIPVRIEVASISKGSFFIY